MKYDDLEKTKDLFDIDTEVPSPIENIEQEGASKDNLTDEFTLGLRDAVEEVKEAVKEPEKPKKEKKSIKKWWKQLSKKKKIIMISVFVLLLILIGVILFFVLRKDEEPNNDKPNVPEVIVEEENYIYKDGVLTFIDKDKNELGTYTCKNKDEKLCYLAYYSEEDEFFRDKNVYEDDSKVLRRTNLYNNTYAFIYDNAEESDGSVLLYNFKEEKTEGIFGLVKGFKDSNYVILKDNNGKYGSYEITEGINKKIDFTFDYLGMINSDAKIVAKTNNKYFIYSRDGKLESKGLEYPIKSYNNNYIVVEDQDYSVYDYKANLIFNEAYQYVGLLDNYAVLIRDKKLYIKDYQNNKYLEEGIELGNTNYDIINVYNKDKVLQESKWAYKIKEEQDHLELTYLNNKNKEKSMDITIYEGKLSANYAFMNYFGGKLYFYKDEDKNELIGSYSCTNKNNVDKNTTEFSNCYIATDSFYSKNEIETDHSNDVGWIPIYNERYVFLNDTLDTKGNNIILYDLVNNKILSKYDSVDSGAYTKDKKITYVNTENSYIMAKNKSNKYGVIAIGQEVKSIIPFNYQSIEKLKEYYMVRESAGSYLLMNNKGEEISHKYGYKIVNYQDKYLTVLNDNKYYVYDFNGSNIDPTGYLYIRLASDYYVVINSEQKLDIHKYNDSSFTLGDDVIPIGNTDYATAFEVTSMNGNFYIKVKNSNTVYEVDANGNAVNY